jgi:hypothetical protein
MSASLLALPTNDIATWAYGVHSKILACGLVATSDTGQQSWAGPPAVGSVIAGAYNLYAFNDSLQTTAPIILKIIWLNAGITVQVGNTTDGAGNFPGTSTSSMPYTMYAQFGGTTQLLNCYFSGAANRFCCALWDGPLQSASLFFGIERTQTTAGVDSNLGMIFLGCGPANISGSPSRSAWCHALIYGYGVAPANTCWPAAVNQAQNTMSNSADLGYAYPIPFNYCSYPYGYSALVYQSTDFIEYYTYAITIYGAAHEYLALSSESQNPTDPTASSHILMRYE